MFLRTNEKGETCGGRELVISDERLPTRQECLEAGLTDEPLRRPYRTAEDVEDEAESFEDEVIDQVDAESAVRDEYWAAIDTTLNQRTSQASTRRWGRCTKSTASFGSSHS